LIALQIFCLPPLPNARAFANKKKRPPIGLRHQLSAVAAPLEPGRSTTRETVNTHIYNQAVIAHLRYDADAG